MTYLCKGFMSLVCLILVSSCDQTSSLQPAMAKTGEGPMRADIDRMEAGIRIAAANKRIDELERQVGALQATPEKLDLDLLINRVAALAAKMDGNASSSGKPLAITTFEPNQTPRPFPKIDEAKHNMPKKASRLNGPEAESKARLAGPDEEGAFNQTK